MNSWKVGCHYRKLFFARHFLITRRLVETEYNVGSINQKRCDFETLPNDGQVCKLDMATFGDCTSEKSFGYNNSAPCIFLKLNRIYGWNPEYYNDISDLPIDMPADLVQHIKDLPLIQRDQIWVTCRGEDGADQEIIGDIKYYPQQGFPSYFYPYLNTGGYVSPLVAVKFTRPKREYLQPGEKKKEIPENPPKGHVKNFY